jgi:hypothetical protein
LILDERVIENGNLLVLRIRSAHMHMRAVAVTLLHYTIYYTHRLDNNNNTHRTALDCLDSIQTDKMGKQV